MHPLFQIAIFSGPDGQIPRIRNGIRFNSFQRSLIYALIVESAPFATSRKSQEGGDGK